MKDIQGYVDRLDLLMEFGRKIEKSLVYGRYYSINHYDFLLSEMNNLIIKINREGGNSGRCFHRRRKSFEDSTHSALDHSRDTITYLSYIKQCLVGAPGREQFNQGAERLETAVSS